LIGAADAVFGVDQSRVGGFRGVVPFSGGGLASGILGGGDDFEILIVKLGVEFLPARQIESAASPTGPGDNQSLLAAKIGKVDDLTFAVGDGEIGGEAGVVESSAEDGDFAEAVDVLIGDYSLADFVGESGEVKPVAILESFREGDADVGAAGALRFDLEFIDSREVFGVDPEVPGVGADLIEGDRIFAEQDCRAGGGRGGER
jgi:hypothetical protein